MELKRKLHIAYELASSYDYVPSLDDETIEELFENFNEYMTGEEIEDLTIEELQTVVDEYMGSDCYDLNNKIRREYFNS